MKEYHRWLRSDYRLPLAGSLQIRITHHSRQLSFHTGLLRVHRMRAAQLNEMRLIGRYSRTRWVNLTTVAHRWSRCSGKALFDPNPGQKTGPQGRRAVEKLGQKLTLCHKKVTASLLAVTRPSRLCTVTDMSNDRCAPYGRGSFSRRDMVAKPAVNCVVCTDKCFYLGAISGHLRMPQQNHTQPANV